MIIQVHFTAREFGIPFLSFSYVLPPYDVFHACCHLASVDDLPIWEREALVEKARLKQEEEEETERLRLREEAKLTLAQQRTHPGRYVDWNKLVGSEKGFRNVKMGSVWSCCGEATETAIGCIDAELSELHARCIRCGTAFFPFEVNESNHTGFVLQLMFPTSDISTVIRGQEHSNISEMFHI
eukprot:m.200222 g.200222  ORF g.200222 m.200222 type:complete len:183 (-) comp18781_c0_seq16:235-783(-)